FLVFARRGPAQDLDVGALASAGHLKMVDAAVQSQEEIDRWLSQECGEGSLAPPNLKYEFLAHAGVVHAQGKRIPLLVFMQDTARLRVFVVSGRDFNLQALQEISSSSIPEYTVDVQSAPNRPDLLYLLIYRQGDTIQRFQVNPGGGPAT